MTTIEQPGHVHLRRSSGKRRGPSLRLSIAAIAGWSILMAMLLGMSDPPLLGSSETVPWYDAMLQLGHVVLFAVLGMLIASGALVATGSERLSTALVAGLLVGGAAAALTEVYQLGVTGRSGNLEDIMLDVTGAASGSAAAWAARLWRTQRGQRRPISIC